MDLQKHIDPYSKPYLGNLMIRLFNSLMILLAFFCIHLMHLAVPSAVKAETNIYVVLDGSGSMWGQVDGVTKVETALGTLYKAVEKIKRLRNSQKILMQVL